MHSQRNVRLMYAIALLQGMVFYGPIATLYRQAQGVTLFQITLIEGISLALLILLEIPWGYVADRIGYKRTLVICNVLFFASKIVFWQARGFGTFLAERLMLSVVLSGLSGCDSAYLYRSAGEQHSPRVFGVYSAMGTAGLVAASVVYSVFIGSDYALAGLLTVASYGISMLLTLALGEVHVESHCRAGLRESARAVMDALKGGRRFLLFLAAAALLAESSQTLTVFMNQPLYLRAGIAPAAMGYLHILVTVAGLTAALSGRLTLRIGEKRLGGVLLAASAIACGVAAVAVSPVLAVACVAVLRVSASVFYPVGVEIQNRQVTSANRATMLSVYSSMMNALAIFTNLAFGALADGGVGWAFGLGAVFCAAALVLYRVWTGFRLKAPRQEG